MREYFSDLLVHQHKHVPRGRDHAIGVNIFENFDIMARRAWSCAFVAVVILSVEGSEPVAPYKTRRDFKAVSHPGRTPADDPEERVDDVEDVRLKMPTLDGLGSAAVVRRLSHMLWSASGFRISTKGAMSAP